MSKIRLVRLVPVEWCDVLFPKRYSLVKIKKQRKVKAPKKLKNYLVVRLNIFY